MHYDDHGPPHFHAVYHDAQALIDIDDLRILKGQIPPQVKRYVMEWASLHQDELREAWEHRTRQEPLGTIDPLP